MKYLQERMKKISVFSGVVKEIAKQMGEEELFEAMEKLANYPEWKTYQQFFINLRNYFADKAYDTEEDDKTRYGRRMYTEGQLDAISLPLYAKNISEKSETLKEKIEILKDKVLKRKYNPTI